MARDEEILFGKIAIKKGYISKKHLKKALAFQEKKNNRIPIGEILLKAEFINQKQLKKVIQHQKSYLKQKDSLTQQKKEDSLFGKVAVQKNYLTEQQLNQALKKQAKLEDRGRVMKLGELLLQENLLTSEEVHNILEAQNKQVMTCVSCNSSYNVAIPPRTKGKELKCPSCEGRLEKTDGSETSVAEDEIAMPEAKESPSETADSTPSEQQTESNKQTSTDIEPGGTMLMDRETMEKKAEMKEKSESVPLQCVICNKEFQEVPDDNGRVECPNCTTIFSASEGIVNEE